MAWQWQSSTNGKLTGTLNGTSKTLSLNGISGNAITTSPQNTVDLVNIVLDIGGKALVVDDKLKYNNTEGAVDNGD